MVRLAVPETVVFETRQEGRRLAENMMKMTAQDRDSVTIQMTNQERELIDCLFSMINSEDNPNWGATDNGYGAPRLNEQKFDELCDQWRALMNERAAYADIIKADFRGASSTNSKLGSVG
jgi:hypothetical protein